MKLAILEKEEKEKERINKLAEQKQKKIEDQKRFVSLVSSKNIITFYTHEFWRPLRKSSLQDCLRGCKLSDCHSFMPAMSNTKTQESSK